MRLVSSSFVDFVEISNEFGVAEIKVFDNWVGKSLMEINIRKKHGLNIVSIISGGEKIVFPGSDYVFSADDLIVIAGKHNDVNAISNFSDKEE